MYLIMVDENDELSVSAVGSVSEGWAEEKYNYMGTY